MAFFLDNAPCHHSKLVKKVIMAWDLNVVFNAPYNPKFNPAELIIAHIKKSIRLQFYKDEEALLEILALKFQEIQSQTIKNYCKHCFDKVLEKI